MGSLWESQGEEGSRGSIGLAVSAQTMWQGSPRLFSACRSPGPTEGGEDLPWAQGWFRPFRHSPVPGLAFSFPLVGPHQCLPDRLQLVLLPSQPLGPQVFTCWAARPYFQFNMSKTRAFNYLKVLCARQHTRPSQSTKQIHLPLVLPASVCMTSDSPVAGGEGVFPASQRGLDRRHWAVAGCGGRRSVVCEGGF